VLTVLAIRKARDHVAGFWAALAFLIKPIAIGLICYPIWKGKWKTAITFAIIAAGMLLLMAGLFGLGSMQSGVPFSITVLHTGSYPPLQNIWGMVHRWFTANEYGWSLANNPMLSLGAGLLLSLGLTVATILFCRPALRPKSWRDVEFGIVLIAIALIVPATWYHHFALLAIPMAILIACAKTRVDFALACIAWSAINIFGVTWHALVGHTLLLDMGTFGALMLWLALMRIGMRTHAADHFLN
jgi:hypothetical protein